MNIDFHYGVIYLVARHAGMAPADAQVVAHACQYVDDATTPGVLKFAEGECFERFASAHKLFDWHNTENSINRLVWVPFHFLPGNQGATIEERSICRKNSDIAKAMVRHALAHPDADNALHRLGVTLHVYVDTWAHQGFSGLESDCNKVTALEGDDYDQATWLRTLGYQLGIRPHWLRQIAQFLGFVGDNLAADVVNEISRLGHGAALHFPDMPYADWRYTNARGEAIHRVNLPDYMEAAERACQVVRAFIARSEEFEVQAGLAPDFAADLQTLLGTNKDHDADRRFNTFCARVAQGALRAVKEPLPPYIAKGAGSWKHQATGISDDDDGTAQPAWSAAFEDSHYRKFHDAIKEHRFVVTQEILPDNGLRLV